MQQVDPEDALREPRDVPIVETTSFLFHACHHLNRQVSYDRLASDGPEELSCRVGLLTNGTEKLLALGLPLIGHDVGQIGRT